ncbi:phosphoglycerate dehydrogenase [Candidatus Calescamantes bacterium]|nr:phosphoglycerate dehydrogenase [Candidatus Calescamantes bacterium]
MRYKVLITSRSFGRVTKNPAIWLENQGFELIYSDLPKPLTEKDMIISIHGMDAAIVGNDEITAQVFKVADRLKVISMHGVGVNHIDLKAAEEKGVVVTNTPGANTEAVAELTIGLIFALARQIPQAHLSTRRGGWERFVGIEIKNKIVGIIGLGRIGKIVARYLRALGTKILAYDVVKDNDFALQMDIHYVELEELLRESDIVTLHIPLTPQTQNLLDSRRLKLMKKGSLLINTARGELIDEVALVTLLKNGYLGGAALDVYTKQPPKGSPLLELDNCITLPHIGAYSREALEQMGMMAAENVVAVIKGERPHNVVTHKTQGRKDKL